MPVELSQTISILEKLVGFDTTSHKTNVPLMLWISAYLENLGVSCRLLPNGSGDKQNLIAQIGPTTGRGIVLSGHTDVVPAIAGKWTSDPFSLVLREGQLFGRGTTDMKGYLANVLAAVPDMVKADLTSPLTLAFSYDEEVGCLGAQALVAALPPDQDVIVGEPTRLHLGVGHKGAQIQCLKITGVAAHSGLPEFGVNAIAHLQPVLTRLAELGTKLSNRAGSYASNLVVTGVSGGGAPNIIPDQSELTWLFRPKDDADMGMGIQEIEKIVSDTRKTLQAEKIGTDVSLTTTCNVPFFQATDTFRAGGLCRAVLENCDGILLPFATEAGIYAAAGHDVIVCGPGDMAQGHIVDEYIEVDDLAAGQKFIEGVIHAASA
ncbi:MAG: acetylornithine deacetylase [Sulfitobacter sp.]